MRISKKIIKVDKVIDEASRKLKLSLLNPLNVAKIKRSFFSKKCLNPILEHGLPDPELIKLKRDISCLNIPSKGRLNNLFKLKKDDILKKIDLLFSIGCHDFTKNSSAIYGVPDSRLVNKAYEILHEKTIKESLEKIPSKEAINLIKKNIKKFDLKYKVRKEDIVASCSVRNHQKLIIIKKKQRFTVEFLNRLIVHEIGTHAFRFENGQMHNLKIFCNGLPNYLSTEEGLAVYNEERFGLLRQSYMKTYAGRVIAIHLSLSNDFHFVFKELKKFLGPKKAFSLTLRAKRGLTDTYMPGAHCKDLSYLKGYFDVKRFVARKGDIEDLYYGKIGVEHVPIVKKLGLKKPLLIPSDFELL